jgi:hypothetical protein
MESFLQSFGREKDEAGRSDPLHYISAQAMTTLTPPRQPRNKGRIGWQERETDAPPKRRRGWGWGFAVLLALAAGLVLCHGCHRGEHDDEPVIFWFKSQGDQKR